MLRYPIASAAAWILLIESVLTLSLAVLLAGMYLQLTQPDWLEPQERP